MADYLITAVWKWIKVDWFWKLVVAVGLALLLSGLLWLAGVNVFNKIGSLWYRAKTAIAQKEIDASRQEAAEAKAIADQALKELAEEKQITSAERAKRELAEKFLADKRLNTDAKLKAYEHAINQPVVSSPVPDDLAALCERAARLGIQCE